MDTDHDLQRGMVPGLPGVKNFLKDRGVEFREVNIEEDEGKRRAGPFAVNNGKRKVPTLRVGERYFSCSPFSAASLRCEHPTENK